MRLVEKKEYLIPNDKGDIVGVLQFSKGEWMLRTYNGNAVPVDFLLKVIGHMIRLNGEGKNETD